MQQDTKNLLLSLALSLLVIVAWNHYFGPPKVKPPHPAQTTTGEPAAQHQPSAAEQSAPAGSAAAPSAHTPQTPKVAAQLTRAEALAQSPRVAIDTKSLSGSISLKGARFDDIELKKYRQTTNPHSPNITLLSPPGARNGYYIELNYVAPQGVSLDLPTSNSLWKASGDRLTPSTPVTLTFDNGKGLVFKRTISVDNDYMFTVKDTVENNGKTAVTLYPDATNTRQGTPKTSGYSLVHEGFIGVIGADDTSTEITYKKIAKETGDKKVLPEQGYAKGGWIGFTSKYWATTVIPDPSEPYQGWFREFPGAVPQYQTDAFGEAKTIQPGASLKLTTRVFAGAKVSTILSHYQKAQKISKFDMLIDWGWFWFITKPMFWLMLYIYKLVGNFGVTILILTLLIRASFFPLANKSYLSMARMKELQPKIKALQELYPDDKMKQQQEQMELFKREKLNPVSGCLPMLLQVPVFFALYKVLFVAIEMRHAPFFGWIKDLSAPDPTNVFTLFGLVHWDPTHLPVFGHFLHLGIWPLIMGVSLWLQMKMNPEPTDPVQKTMFAWMPVIFTFMLGSFPAGLVIYYTWSNLLSAAQQGLIMKKAGIKVELFDNLKKVFGRKPA